MADIGEIMKLRAGLSLSGGTPALNSIVLSSSAIRVGGGTTAGGSLDAGTTPVISWSSTAVTLAQATTMGSATASGTTHTVQGAGSADADVELQLKGTTGGGSNTGSLTFYSGAGSATVGKIQVTRSGSNTGGKMSFYTALAGVLTEQGSISNAGAWNFPVSTSTALGIFSSAGSSATNIRFINDNGPADDRWVTFDFNSNGAFTINCRKPSDGTIRRQIMNLDNVAGTVTVGASGSVSNTCNGQWNIDTTSGVVPLVAYRRTSTTTDYLQGFYSDVGGTLQIKFRVEADGDVISATNSYTSDARAKKDIQPIQYGLAEVMQLAPKSFRWWHESDEDVKSFCCSTAQEVQAIMPELVRDDGLDGPDGEVMKAVYEKEIVAVLVKAIQEQQAMILALKDEIDALKAR